MKIGNFADTAATELPADDALKESKLDLSKPDTKETKKPTDTTPEKEVVKAETKSEVSSEEKKPEIEKKDTSNPNLTTQEKEATASAEDDDELPAHLTKGMTTAAIDNAKKSWKTIRGENKQLAKDLESAKTEIDGLKKQVSEASKTPSELEASKKEIEGLKKRLEEYEGEISITRVEGTKQFKEAIAGPLSVISSDMEGIAKRYEIPADTLMRAISEPDGAKRADAIEEITSDFKGVDKLEVVQASRDFQKLQKMAAEMRQNASAKLEELNNATKAEQERELAANTRDYRQAVSTEWDSVQQSIPYIRKVDGQTQWNEHLEGIRHEIEAMNVNELPVEEVARMGVSHRILPEILAVAKHYQGEASKQKERADKAEKQLAEFHKKSPGAGGGNSTSSESKKSSSGLFSDTVLEPAAR